MSYTFDPDNRAFTGLNAPVRFEGTVQALEVVGELPPGLNGEYYRVGPDPAYPPFHKNFFPVVDGDGMIVMFSIREGRVDYRSRYVETERLRLQRAANRALFGAYRNPFSDDPTVAGANRGSANTTMRMHAGVLWALKEDSPGMAIEPVTLDTIGVNDFRGAMTSRTMTAHPKIDPKTGEMIFYGSAAKGETTPDIALLRADADGNLVDEQWLVAPYASMMHDFVVTERWIVFPVMPTTSNLERIRAGGPIYDWEPERGMYLGLMPRGGAADEIRWVQSDARWFYHVMAAHDDPDDPNLLVMDVTESGCQPFPFLHVDPARTWRPDLAQPTLTRWTVDTRTGAFTARRLLDTASEMPRIDERYELGSYRHGYVLVDDPAHPNLGPGRMNSLAHLDHATGAVTTVFAGEHTIFEEPQFVPRSPEAPEGDGWLLALRHHADTMLTDLVVLDTDDLPAGPVAVVRLPFRVRPGTHGTWVDAM